MLTKRIIPCLDVKDGRVVKGINFKNLQDAGSPIEIAEEYQRQKADELVFLDITASIENRDIILDVVSKTAACVFMPLTVGGGIRSIADIRRLLNAGADKVSINSSAVNSPELIKEASLKFGSQCIVVAIDAKKTALYTQSHKCWEVFINAGSTPSGLDAVQWAKEAEKLGAGEILLTSIDYDGTKNGYDIELTQAITSNVNIPVIASGGAGKKEHFYEVLTRAHADAALAASLFHYQELTVGQVKQYLQSKGVLVR